VSQAVDDLSTRIRQTVLSALPEGNGHPELRRFVALLRDYPGRAGKTLRGQIVMFSAQAHGGDERAALTAAAGVELFQNWVLIHDDIEDDSEERRGRPALHRLVGSPIAINVGDALHVAMWRLLMTLPATSSEGLDREAVLHEFLWMIERTAEGQHLDLSWVAAGRFDVTEEDYLTMVTLKTAYYTVVCPLRLGAACAGVDPSPDFETAGIDLGIAFQIRDDVLNLTPGVAYGKEFAGDLYEGKRTLILAHLLAHASHDEGEAIREALNRPRDARRPEGVRDVLAAIERHGSLAYAQAVAERRARRGLERLAEALRALPGRAATRELEGLLRSLALRST
jgi:geranylgeranyl diphosphate synthase type II